MTTCILGDTISDISATILSYIKIYKTANKNDPKPVPLLFKKKIAAILNFDILFHIKSAQNF